MVKKKKKFFWAREIAQHRDYSENTAQEIDKEVQRIILGAMDKAEKLLSENLNSLHRLSAALLEHEILDGEQIDMVLKGKKLPRKKDIAEEPATKKRVTRKKKETKDSK